MTISSEPNCRCLCHSGKGKCGVAPCCDLAGIKWEIHCKTDEEKAFSRYRINSKKNESSALHGFRGVRFS